jgi:hypothetical protein
MLKFGLAAAAAALLLSSAPALAQAGNPWRDGDNWQVTGIHVKDGSGIAYGEYLANTWQRQQEFAKSKGWIKGYHVLRNVNRREGEPSHYLIVVGGTQVDAAEQDRRAAETHTHMGMSEAQLEAASGARGSIRTIGNQTLLREQVRR